MNKKLLCAFSVLLVVLIISGCGERLAARRALRDQQLDNNAVPSGGDNVGPVTDDLGMGGSELDEVMTEEDESDLDAMGEDLDSLQDL